MAKENCLTEKEISSLASGDVKDEERIRMIAHLKECDACKEKLRQTEGLLVVLSNTERDKNGKLHTEPLPCEHVEKDLREVLRKKLEPAMKRRQAIHKLLARIAKELLPEKEEVPVDALSVGYAATRPGVADELQDALLSDVTILVERLFAPDVGHRKRVEWVEQLLYTLDKLQEEDGADDK